MGQYSAAIQKLYVSYFARPADAGGLKFWESVAEAQNGNLAAISTAFSQSDEYKAVFSGKSHADIVDQVYVNLFGRHAESAGKAFWVGLLDRGVIQIDRIVETLGTSAQGSDVTALQLKVLAASTFTDALKTATEINAYSGDVANAVAKAFLASVHDAGSYTAAFAVKGALQLARDAIEHGVVHDGQIIPPGIAVGEPNGNFGGGVAGVAVGEPNPNAVQGIAVGEPNSGMSQGFAVGEPHPSMAQGFAVGEPSPASGDLIKLVGVDMAVQQMAMLHF